MTHARPYLLILPTCLLIAVAVAGCSGSRMKPEVAEDPTGTDPAVSDLETWIGKSEKEVVTYWGKPDKKQPDGEGGELLTYAEIRVQYDRPTLLPLYDDRTTPTGSGSTRPEIPGDIGVEEHTKAKFWVNGDGYIYRYWFAPEVYKKGLAWPPKTIPVDDEESRD